MEIQRKNPDSKLSGFLYFLSEDDLLSHGETPHYHRRCIISLLSSGWDQVVLILYGLQTKLTSSSFTLRDYRIWSLAMSYSHMGKPHTTIGDRSFHC